MGVLGGDRPECLLAEVERVVSAVLHAAPLAGREVFLEPLAAARDVALLQLAAGHEQQHRLDRLRGIGALRGS